MNVENDGALPSSNPILNCSANVDLISPMLQQQLAVDMQEIHVLRKRSRESISTRQHVLHIEEYKTAYMKLGEKRKISIGK